jgi:hypothetical protein
MKINLIQDYKITLYYGTLEQEVGDCKEERALTDR